MSCLLYGYTPDQDFKSINIAKIEKIYMYYIGQKNMQTIKGNLNKLSKTII